MQGSVGAMQGIFAAGEVLVSSEIITSLSGAHTAVIDKGGCCIMSGIYVASPVEDYFELCHAEDGGLSEEEQKLTHLITRAPSAFFCFHTKVLLHQPVLLDQ